VRVCVCTLACVWQGGKGKEVSEGVCGKGGLPVNAIILHFNVCQSSQSRW